MTMDSTALHARHHGRPNPVPAGPADAGAEIETAAAVITDSEYCDADTEIRDDPACGAGQDAALTFEGGDGCAATGVRHDVRRRRPS